MTLDPTARESNVRDSLKKYFVDNLHTKEGIILSFDKQISDPAIHKVQSVNRWISIKIGAMDRNEMGRLDVDLYCAVRQDPESFRLAQLCDTVMGHLTDTTQTDTMRRIPFYRSRETGAWTLLGALLVVDVLESGEEDGPDSSKFKILTLTIRWSAKI
ncbi:hypothetical protein LCGC14_1082990 [marine sediment metagenome]|uniref:Uncharacterized protein n=1 Tax=marine sediment metagenome TaxID=412755 RepID=A0A0F9MET7_9ZZZZ|nr:hypothetical protein [Pricia sp.]